MFKADYQTLHPTGGSPLLLERGEEALHGRVVHRDLGQAALRHSARSAARLDGLAQQPLHAPLTDAAAPAAERGGVDGQAMLEEGLAGEVLEIRVLTQRASTASSERP
ncbi:hypothetical protein RMHFA_05687 [Roseomonas mucosa]|nr:hypothetical protein RMHFA_05687 [Roseomonas mucosa]